MVLGGRVNKSLVSLIQQAGGQAVGLTGKDGALLRARQVRHAPEVDSAWAWLDKGREYEAGQWASWARSGALLRVRQVSGNGGSACTTRVLSDVWLA